MTRPSPDNSPTITVGLCEGPANLTLLDWPADCGAESVFLGRTRVESHAEFGPLLHLEYECYGPMAQKLLEAMAHDAAERWGCRAIRIVHATGRVDPGQASVVIQVATPHRAEAFAACRYLIDRIKHELPIWKREVWERGTTFVEGCCAHGDDEGKPVAGPGRAEQHAQRARLPADPNASDAGPRHGRDSGDKP